MEQLTTDASMDVNSQSWSIKSLFGPLFSVNEESKANVFDPSLADTHKFLVSMFGEHISEVDIDTEARVEDAFKANETAVEVAELEGFFGPHGARALLEEPIKSFTILNATVPTTLKLPKSDEAWLVEMPKIQPNRQTVHADPKPFTGNCPYLTSTSRMLFTPSNVMRWSFSSNQKAFVSNSRLVRWSDGSATLHIGDDIFTLNDWKSTAEVHLVGSETIVEKNGVQLPAFTSAQDAVKRHLVMDSAEAASVQLAVAEENAMNSDESKKRKLGYTTNILPPINWEKPSKDRNVYEEFIFNEYERRKKEIIRRQKEGQPMTLGEQMRLEEKLAQLLQAANEGAINLEETNAVSSSREEFISQRQHKRSYKKFERSLGLEGGTRDPLFEEENSQSDDEDYEDIIESMKRKRDDNNEETRRKQSKHESSADMVEKLAVALESLKNDLPASSDVFFSVDGTVEMLRDSMSLSLVKKELESIIETITNQHPSLNISEIVKIAQEISE